MSLRCAYCHASADDAAPCQGCGTLLHPECWRDVTRCPTLGCSAGRRVRVEPPPVARSGVPRWAGVVGMLLVIWIARVVGGTYSDATPGYLPEWSTLRSARTYAPTVRTHRWNDEQFLDRGIELRAWAARQRLLPSEDPVYELQELGWPGLVQVESTDEGLVLRFDGGSRPAGVFVADPEADQQRAPTKQTWRLSASPIVGVYRIWER